jgi:hypothetical protein
MVFLELSDKAIGLDYFIIHQEQESNFKGLVELEVRSIESYDICPLRIKKCH